MITCANELVWKSEKGEELIRFSGSRYQVVPAWCDVEKLAALREAIDAVLERARVEGRNE